MFGRSHQEGTANMLSAHRFTTVPTSTCRNRLEQALSNEKPIARGESNRSAVIVIQSALSDLNQSYLLPAEVDGYFGPRTYAAVEAFQRDYGLAADGIVGRQTLTQLDTLFSGDVVRHPIGRSIHIGVDRLDAGHYGGDFALGSCVNDARKMQEIAQALGYDATTLENENATTSNFTGFLRQAISDLFGGDSLLITYSGHGSQIPSVSGDEEPDLLDETLCLYDRMLIDDELYALLAQLRESVRVHAVFDSCHSGTVYKDILLPATKGFDELQKDYFDNTVGGLKELVTVSTVEVTVVGEDVPVSSLPITAGSLSKALDGEKPDLQPPPSPKKDLSEDVAALFAGLNAGAATGKSKAIENADSFPIYDNNKALYDAIRTAVGSQENQHLSCSLVTLSACQDAQTTPAGQVYSLFTYNVMTAWSSGSFDGSYSEFYSRLKGVSPPSSTPEMHSDGTGRGEFRLFERPFAF
jgi:hypothetical protein